MIEETGFNKLHKNDGTVSIADFNFNLTFPNEDGLYFDIESIVVDGVNKEVPLLDSDKRIIGNAENIKVSENGFLMDLNLKNDYRIGIVGMDYSILERSGNHILRIALHSVSLLT